jgi:LPXTG-motif cell wall-anchored protein
MEKKTRKFPILTVSLIGGGLLILAGVWIYYKKRK